MNLLYALLIGVAMGALLQRVGASSPTMILGSLRLENLTVIKFMATTIAVGTVAVHALSYWLPMHFDVRPAYLLGVTVGGLIFGVGFALAGYCPGTCLVGLGEGRRDALATLLGGLAGTLGFALVALRLEGALIRPLNLGNLTLAELLHAPPMVIATALAVVLLGVVVVLPTARGGGVRTGP
jgi:uncharacterized membrane protein YedE/YeeE